jgi:C_GCAxxG_C_C family probable redox protein
MSVQEESLRLHGCGFNCAQSVLAALGSYTGMEEKTALALSGGFGGGVRCGEICGAASGAVMALGLAFPYADGEDAEAKSRIAKLTMKMNRDFLKEFGCIRCQDLKRNGIPCDELIAWAAAHAEEIIQENKN